MDKKMTLFFYLNNEMDNMLLPFNNPNSCIWETV